MWIVREVIARYREDYPDDAHTDAEVIESLLASWCEEELISQTADGRYLFPSLKEEQHGSKGGRRPIYRPGI